METLKDTIVFCQFFPTTPAIQKAIPARVKSSGVEIGLRMCEMEFITMLPIEMLQSLYAQPNSSTVQSCSLATDNSNQALRSPQRPPHNHPGQHADQNQTGQHAGRQQASGMMQPAPVVRLNPPPSYGKVDMKSRELVLVICSIFKDR